MPWNGDRTWPCIDFCCMCASNDSIRRGSGSRDGNSRIVAQRAGKPGRVDDPPVACQRGRAWIGAPSPRSSRGRRRLLVMTRESSVAHGGREKFLREEERREVSGSLIQTSRGHSEPISTGFNGIVSNRVLPPRCRPRIGNETRQETRALPIGSSIRSGDSRDRFGERRIIQCRAL